MLPSKFISDSPSKRRIDNEDYLIEQIDQINKRIFNYQQLIKQKISLLIGNNTKSMDYDGLQKQLSDLRLEEQNYGQIQFDMDRQQSQVFDYYETEFNKLKQLYETITQEHQGFLQQKQQANEFYRSLIETKSILQEDLSARLLQRAELVGQKEELEEFVEQIKAETNQLFQIAQMYFTSRSLHQENSRQIQQLEIEIKKLKQQKEEKQQQLSLFHQATLLEVQLHQANQKIKMQRNKLVPVQKSLNLAHPDTLLCEFQQLMNIQTIEQPDFSNKLSSYIQSFRNNLFRNGNQGANWGSLKEFILQLEQFILVSMQQKAIQQQLSDMRQNLKQFGEETLVQNEAQTIDFQVEEKHQKIQVLYEQQEKSKENEQMAEEQYQKLIEQYSLTAFEMYKEKNKDQLEEMKEIKDYDQMLQGIYGEIIVLVQQSQDVRLNNILKLIEKYESSEAAIKINIQMVDQQILPQLKQLVAQLSKVKREIEQLNQCDRQHLEKTGKIEQEIQMMENEFKQKMDSFQQQETEINNQVMDIKKQIEIVQDQMISRIKPNKAQLEQEILRMNNMVSQLQEQKQSLEQLTYNRSPSRNSTVLSISKSLNQLVKHKPNITPTKQMRPSQLKINSSIKSIK